MFIKKRRFDWSYLLLCPYLMVAFIPKVVYYFHHRVIAPLMLVWAVLAFASQRQVRFPKAGVRSLIAVFMFLGLYAGLSTVYSLFGYGSGLTYGQVSDFILTAFPLLVFHLSVCNGRVHELRWLVMFCLSCIVVSAVMTILGESVVEGGSRALTGATGEGADLEKAGAAFQAGIGTYGHIYGMGLLVFPVLYCGTFMPRRMKILVVGFAVVVLAAVYRAGYSICIIGIFLAGFLYLVAKISVKAGIMKWVGCVLVALLVSIVANPKIIRFLQDPLDSFSYRIQKQEYQSRLNAVVDMVSGSEDSYAAYRAGLYWMSWKVFLRHPVFGIGDAESRDNEMLDVGGHSLVFDTLAIFGLFGLSTLILFFIFYYRYIRHMSAVALGYKWLPAYYLFLFSFSAIAFINPIGGAIVFSDMLLIIPALAYCVNRKHSGMQVQRAYSHPQMSMCAEVGSRV